MNGACIGARRAWVSFDLVRNLVLLSSTDDMLENDWVDVRATADDGTSPLFEASILTWVAVRRVGGVPDIDGNSEVWIL